MLDTTLCGIKSGFKVLDPEFLISGAWNPLADSRFSTVQFRKTCSHGAAIATTRSTSEAKPLLSCVDLWIKELDSGSKAQDSE